MSRQDLCIRVLVAGALAGAVGAGNAQATNGSISGTLTDQTGAVVRGATVTLLNIERNLAIRTVTTDSAGFYTAPSLPLGTYTVRLAGSGFRTEEIKDVVLHVNDTLTINRALTPGGTGETVTVEADQLQVNLENATQAGLINGTQVRELVLSSRNYEQLVGLQPGVAYSGADQIYIGNSSPNGSTNVVNFSVNGARTSGNAWTIDGADNEDRGSNYTLLPYTSVDAIAEFKTLRGTYEAEFGRSASGQINVATKSGTSQFHGDAYAFVRNDIFNANDTLNKLTTSPSGAAKVTSPRSLLRYNDFGYTVGGPVWVPHLYDGRHHGTFFFFSQELRRVIPYKPLTLTGVPSLAERQGIFRVPVCASTNATGKCNNAGTTAVPITSTLAQQYLKDIYANVPAPDPTGTLVTAPQRNLFNGNQQLVRIDQQLGQKLSAFFRYIHDSIPTQEPGGLFQGSGYPGVNTTNTNAPGFIYLGRMNSVLSPTLVLEGGYATRTALFSATPSVSQPTQTRRTSSPICSFPPRLPAFRA